MNIQTYLERLQRELKGLPPEEEALFVEEISSHFSEGLSDPGLGAEEPERLERLAREMGDPEDLGRRLKDVHHPKRWLEYLLIVIPEIFVLPVLSWIVLVVFFGPGGGPEENALFVYWGIRASVFFQFCLVLIGLWLYKRQGLLAGLLYWLSSLWLTVFVMCFRERGWAPAGISGQTAQTVFWIVALVVLLAWLVRLLSRRKDPLFFTMTLIPFLIAVGNLATTRVILSGGFPEGYSLADWNLIWNFGPFELAHIIWPALFLFPKQRVFRWLGLGVYTAPIAVLNLIESTRYPYLVALWILPFVLVGVNGGLETIRHKHKPRIAR